MKSHFARAGSIFRWPVANVIWANMSLITVNKMMAKQLSESQRRLQAAPGELPTAEDVLQIQPAVTRNSRAALGDK